ncbi:hypothetical protein [Ekhidna sp.]
MKIKIINKTFLRSLFSMLIMMIMIGCVDKDSLEVNVSDQSIVSLQDVDATIFEDETISLEVTFVEPAKSSGTIVISFSGNGVYGIDFTTNPQGSAEGLSIPVSAGDEELKIEFIPVFKSGTVEEDVEFNVSVDATGGVAFNTKTETTITVVNRPEVFVTSDLDNFASTLELENSASQNFTVGAFGLEAGLVITAPNNFEVSLNDTDFSSSVTLSPDDINNQDTLVYARFSPGFDSLGTIAGSIVLESTDAISSSVTLSGTSTEQPPTILVDGTPLNLGGTAAGGVTSSQVVEVSGYRFTENVAVSTTGPFELSLDDIDFSTSADLDLAILNAGNPINVFIRFAPTSGLDGLKTGTITLSSAGAIDQVIDLEGNEGLSLIAFTSFEEPVGLDEDYVDTGDAAVSRILENNDGQAPVRFTSTGGELGFVTVYQSTGGEGSTDGDDLGVTTKTSIVGTTTQGGYTDGVQGYYVDDTDGIIRLVFEPVDVSSLSILRLSLDYLFNDTSWEPEDYISVVIETAEGLETEVLNLNGDDIETGGLDPEPHVWNTLDVDISGQLGNTVRLKIEISTDSAAEEVYFDNIQFFGN